MGVAARDTPARPGIRLAGQRSSRRPEERQGGYRGCPVRRHPGPGAVEPGTGRLGGKGRTFLPPSRPNGSNPVSPRKNLTHRVPASRRVRDGTPRSGTVDRPSTGRRRDRPGDRLRQGEPDDRVLSGDLIGTAETMGGPPPGRRGPGSPVGLPGMNVVLPPPADDSDAAQDAGSPKTATRPETGTFSTTRSTDAPPVGDSVRRRPHPHTKSPGGSRPGMDHDGAAVSFNRASLAACCSASFFDRPEPSP